MMGLLHVVNKNKSNPVLSELTPVEKGDKNENGRVASLAYVLIHYEQMV